MGNVTRVLFVLINIFAMASVASARPALPFPFPNFPGFPGFPGGPGGPGHGGPGGGHGGPGHGGPGGGGPGGMRTVTINDPRKDGYVLFSGNNRDQTAMQICIENGYQSGRVLSLGWVSKAPAAEFFNGWRFYPQADNYQAITAVECAAGRPNGPGPGPGPGPGGRPDAVYPNPAYQNYPILDDVETANAFCRMQGFMRGQTLQPAYVDTNPVYYFRFNQWNFSPRADHYNRIAQIGCFRR